jgi:NADPH-dependent ferric siderophore reductase
MLDVSRLCRLGPRLLRVTLTGADLAGFRTVAPTDHVTLFFPTERDARPRLPHLPHAGGGHRHRPMRHGGTASEDPGRVYTVRAFDADAGELDVDIVLHGDGVATRWAAGARPGDQLGVLGPRFSVVGPTGVDWYLFAVDETGLPTAARWLAELPSTARAILVAEVADTADEVDLPSTADVTVTWLHRDRLPDGALARAVRESAFPPGDGFVWVAGEATALGPVRRHLRDERYLDPTRFEVHGYWKRGVADHGQERPH